MRTSPVIHAPPALLVAVVAVLAAGCGGSHPPGVASLGAPATTTTNPPGGSSTATGPLGGKAAIGRFVLNGGDAKKFAACMRAHGVPNFPDPNSQGEIDISPSAGLDPGSAAFRSAQGHCSALLPNGGRPSPQQEARMRAGALAFSACMRKHGVANFPDPTFLDGGAQIRITGGSGGNLDPRSPVFQAAQRACRGKLVGAVGGQK